MNWWRALVSRRRLKILTVEANILKSLRDANLDPERWGEHIKAWEDHVERGVEKYVDGLPRR